VATVECGPEVRIDYDTPDALAGRAGPDTAPDAGVDVERR